MKKTITLFIACATTLLLMSQVLVHKKLSKDFYALTGTTAPKGHLHHPTSPHKMMAKAPSVGSIQIKMDSVVTTDSNTVFNKWVNISKYAYAYDGNGNDTLNAYYQWDLTNNVWINTNKDAYTYNANNSDTLDVYSQWSNAQSIWVKVYQDQYAYDGNNNDTLDVFSQWDAIATQWNYVSKDVYSYNTNGNDTLDLYSQWDTLTTQWASVGKYTYYYDGNDNDTLNLYAQWDTLSKTFLPTEKDVYIYDANGNELSDLFSVFDTTAQQWIPAAQDQYSYDANGNDTLLVSSTWDVPTATWIVNNKTAYTYNNAYASGVIAYPQPFLNTDFAHQVLTNVATNNQAGVWLAGNKTQYYYSPYVPTLPASVASVTAGEVVFSLSPNPTTDLVLIKWTDDSDISLNLTLYNANGKLMLQQTVSNNAILSIGKLPAGLYIYTLSNNTKMLNSGKIEKFNY
jgi:hypothetical protein